MAILNLTQHQATEEQKALGVVDLEGDARAALLAAITFDTPPMLDELRQRAAAVAEIARATGCKRAMVGGAPFFAATLEFSLLRLGIQPLYAFSRRESIEEIQADGTVRKTAVFRHLGWVGAFSDFAWEGEEAQPLGEESSRG